MTISELPTGTAKTVRTMRILARYEEPVENGFDEEGLAAILQSGADAEPVHMQCRREIQASAREAGRQRLVVGLSCLLAITSVFGLALTMVQVAQ
ncbi:MAG: hypothetical protein WCL38_06335 [Actinomycetota bacterium]